MERRREERRGGERGEEGGRRKTRFIAELAMSWTKAPVQQSGKVHRCYMLPRGGGQSAPSLAVRTQNRVLTRVVRTPIEF